MGVPWKILFLKRILLAKSCDKRTILLFLYSKALYKGVSLEATYRYCKLFSFIFVTTKQTLPKLQWNCLDNFNVLKHVNTYQSVFVLEKNNKKRDF